MERNKVVIGGLYAYDSGSGVIKVRVILWQDGGERRDAGFVVEGETRRGDPIRFSEARHLRCTWDEHLESERAALAATAVAEAKLARLRAEEAGAE